MLKMKSPLNFIYDGNTAIYTSLLPECMFCLKPCSETVSALFSIENPQTGFTCIIKDRWMLMLGGLFAFWVTTTARAEFGWAFVYWKRSKSLIEQDEMQRGGGGTSWKALEVFGWCLSGSLSGYWLGARCFFTLPIMSDWKVLTPVIVLC